MKLIKALKINSLRTKQLSRLIPVVFLIMAFVAGSIVMSQKAALSKEADTIPQLKKTITEQELINTELDDVTEYRISSILSANISDDKEYYADFIVEPEYDVSDMTVRIKIFTFKEFAEDKENESIIKELGYTVDIKRILLDPLDYELTVETELAADDYDIAYMPYRETIYIIKAGSYYQDFTLTNGSTLFSFNDENIGIVSNNYPAAGLFYNKSIIEEAGLEDPMDLLERGEWDLSTFYGYLEKTSIDRNGDGFFEVFGIVINEDLTDNLAAANGTQILSLADEGSLSLNINNPEFKKILDFINSVYSNGYKGGMARQGFIDQRASFYNDDASAYTGLKEVMDADIGFISYPSDIGLIKSASSKVEIAIINKNKVIDDVFMYLLDDITKPCSSSLTYFAGIFEDERVATLCVEMTKSNYISPIHMFKELHEFYLDMLRDVKAGFSVTQTVESFGSENSLPVIQFP